MTGQQKANEKPTPHVISDQVLTPILKGKLAIFGNFSKTGQKSIKKYKKGQSSGRGMGASA
jgi:hypothetical protein